MKRVFVVFILVLCVLSSAFAGDHQHISLSFGHQAWMSNKSGIDVFYGINLGLGRRSEMSVWGESQLTPSFFGQNAMGIGFSYALLGDISTASQVAGVGMNTLINAGIIFTENNPWSYFIPTDVYISITPISIGNPVSAKRERILEMGVTYNWFENRFGFMFSLMKFDYYLRGSYRDYEIL